MTRGEAAHHETYTYLEARNKFEAFERLLRSHQIGIKPGSELERIGIEIHRLPDALRDRGSLPVGIDIREYFAEVMGLNDLVDKLLAVQSHPRFSQLVPLLNLLNEGQPSQVALTRVTDQAANRLFELLVGTCAMRFADIVSMESADRPGANPDVMVVAVGKLWGVACKVLYSGRIETFADNVVRGVEQINRSRADRGLVLVNMKNNLGYDQCWPLAEGQLGTPSDEPELTAFPSLESALQVIQQAADEFARKLSLEGSGRGLGESLRQGKSMPAIGLFFPVSTGIVRDGKPTPTYLPGLAVVPGGRLQTEDREFLQRLHQALIG